MGPTGRICTDSIRQSRQFADSESTSAGLDGIDKLWSVAMSIEERAERARARWGVTDQHNAAITLVCSIDMFWFFRPDTQGIQATQIAQVISSHEK